MKVSDAFGSFLKCENLHGKRVLVTIDHVEEVKVGDDTKHACFFQGKNRALILNLTNSNSIAAIIGDEEMDNWGGHQILLHPDRTMFAGKMVDCIRVAPPGKKAAPAPPPREPEWENEQGANDSEIPF